MMKRRGIFLLLVVTLLLLPSVFSLSLSGDKLGPIIFEPGKVIINKYKIDGTNKQVEVTVGGDLQEYVNLSEMVNNEFEMRLQFPEQFLKPGTYSFSLTVKEVSDSLSGISSLLAVSKQFVVEVYSYEKAVEVSFGAADINVNGTVPFVVSVKSRTYSDINSVWAEIIVYDRDNLSVGRVRSKEGKLKALQTGKLEASFNATGLLAGDYSALAMVRFDGQEETARTTFRIGALNVLIKNYTSRLEQGFNEFLVEVENDWGNELENVYAKLFINDQELLQTPSINLPPWGSGRLSAIVKIELPPGEYAGRIKLFYEGEMKEEKIILTVVEAAKEERGKLFYLFLTGVVIIIVLLAVLISLSLSRKDQQPVVSSSGKKENRVNGRLSSEKEGKEKKEGKKTKKREQGKQDQMGGQQDQKLILE